MTFDRRNLPEPVGYYEAAGLTFRERRGKWRTTRCEFHGGSDSMRINTQSGGFVCMADCGARGGDVLSYHMAATGQNFIDAAKELGAWVEDEKPANTRPAPFSARDGLQVLHSEASIVAICAVNQARGVVLTEADRERLTQAVGRIAKIAGVVL